jgi:hypothetical protein
MTLDEAIRLIQDDINDESVDWNTPLGEAYKLSFEALKLNRLMRETYAHPQLLVLPGETGE